MNPNAPSTSPAPGPEVSNAAQGFVEIIRTRRQNASYVLLGLSVVFLGLTIFLAAKSFRTPEAKPEEKPPEVNPMDPEAPPPPAAEIADPKKGDYTAGWLGTMFAFLITAGAGVWCSISPTKPTVDSQRTDARILVLVVGGLLGFALIAFGGWFFWRWSDSLLKAIEKVEWIDLKWVVYPLLMIAGGAGLVLLAIQPARAEERHNTLLRRLVYGSNLGLTVLLLFIVLVVGNVVYAVQGKSRLDTTSTGFYSLSEPTQNFLGQLEQPVTAYAILGDGSARVTDDIRRLLQGCEDAGGGKFKIKNISPQTNKTDLATLRTKYTQLELNDTGVLLVVGDEDRPGAPAGRYVFIRENDFLDRDASMGRDAQPSFAGEGKLIRELMFLAENRMKPVVYFTQSNKELSLEGGGPHGGGDTGPERSASQLKAFLEKNYLDVRPLTLDPVKPAIPPDADVVVIASPRSPFSPVAADALKQYLNAARPGGKKGKLVVLAGNPDPREARKSVPTGLESVLQPFNIGLGSNYLFGIDSGQPMLLEMPTGFTESAVRGKNSIAQTLRRFPPRMILPREVMAISPGSPEFKTTVLLVTATDLVWPEAEFPESVNRLLADLQQHPERKQVTRSRTVGVVCAETSGTGRVAVFGSGFIASDAWAQETRGTAPAEFDLIGVTIDWLRDRPPVPPGVTTKTYTTYTFPPKVDTTRLLWFPLGLTFLTVVGLGTGVWMIRRK